tara:strand:- start:544 stop:969 length:426 start_codon:yes stop_codon:yes gene_type:complete
MDDLMGNLYIPECNNGILVINGTYYTSRQLDLDNMNSEAKKGVAKEIYNYTKNNPITVLILNFKVNDLYFYKTETQLSIICNILDLILSNNMTPFTIDINENLFYYNHKLNSLITKLLAKNFTIKKAKIYLHHSLHNKDKE